MIINPHKVLEKCWLTCPECHFEENQIQPNGIDVRLKGARQILIQNPFKLFPENTIHADSREVDKRVLKNGNESLFFERYTSYSVETYEYISLPKDVVAVVYGRSSLNRNGIFARSSIYDSGFEDYVGFTLYPFINMEACIGIRIAQIVFFSADSPSLYGGQYGVNRKV